MVLITECESSCLPDTEIAFVREVENAVFIWRESNNFRNLTITAAYSFLD